MYIIALDIDDCIYPSNVNYFGLTNDDFEMLEINLKRLVMILDKYNMMVFMTSSFYSRVRLEGKDLKWGCDSKHGIKHPPYYQYDKEMMRLLQKYLDGYWYGLSCGGRGSDVRRLVNEHNKVIILDDMPLDSFNIDDVDSNKYTYIKTIGFINGNVGYRIKNFIEGK